MDARNPTLKVAVVARGESPAAIEGRFAAVFAALRGEGLAPEPCLYAEEAEAEVRGRLLACAAALVWVNPVQDGRRRAGLDALLREAAGAGVRVSAHPDVVDRLGTKAVLWRTRELGWSGDARGYQTPEALLEGLPRTLAAGPRVLKPNRGNGGIGVWKVEAVVRGRLRVQAADGDEVRIVAAADFLADRIAEFADVDGFVDQVFQPRLGDGMIRCYMAGERLAGFGAQRVRALMPPGAEAWPRLYSGADDPRFQRLKRRMEDVWTPALARILGLRADELPAIWDADFLLGPPDPDGADTYVLCEINASSVFPLPDKAPAALARVLSRRLDAKGPSSGERGS